jgi:hypothetical protein
MTRAEINNALKYALLALAAFAVGCATALVPQLMDVSQPALNWRIVLGTGITAVITAYGGAMLPRAGSTGIAAQVDTLKAGGTARSEMVVLSQDEAAPRLAGALSPDQVRQIVAGLADALHGAVVDAVIARMQATPQPKDLPADPVGHISALLDQDERGRSDP